MGDEEAQRIRLLKDRDNGPVSRQIQHVCNADFADGLTDSKITTDGIICKFGGHTFVPIPWACKKQTAVSHSSTAEELTCWNLLPVERGVTLRVNSYPKH